MIATIKESKSAVRLAWREDLLPGSVLASRVGGGVVVGHCC